MSSVNDYTPKYVDECRKKITAQLVAYQDLIDIARKIAPNEPKFHSATLNFEPYFFNNMVVTLESYFVNRKEAADGTGMSEVRILSDCITNNNSVFALDAGVAYDPAKSVLKYGIWDAIKLSKTDFLNLSEKFFAEIVDHYL